VTVARNRSPISRAEAWLWTGPVGHLVGGALDLLEAVVRYQVQRARRRRAN
jgi:hypothetical protein